MSAQSIRSTRGSSPILAAMRVMWNEFPEMRKLLEDGNKRNRMHTLLAATVGREYQVSTEEAIAIVMGAGYHVTRGPVEIAPVASIGPGAEKRTPAPDKVLRTVTASSQLGRLLRVYATYPESGITDDEAQRMSGISERSCWWKRCGELRSAGLIEPMEDEQGVQITRIAESGRSRVVCRITPEGASVAATLE